MEEDEVIDPEDQDRASREKFKREREDDSSKEISPVKRERNSSPNNEAAKGRKREREKYDDFGRISREKENSISPERNSNFDKDSSKEEDKRDRPRSSEKFDSYRPTGNRSFRRNNRGESSPDRIGDKVDRGRIRRDSPPVKRRRNDWDSRGSRGGYNLEKDRYSRIDTRDRYQRESHRDIERSKIDIFNGSLKNLKQFAEFQSEDISQSELEKRYQEYQEEYKKRQNKIFFEDHKNEEWFKEKYEPSYLEKKRIQRIEKSIQAFKSFGQEISTGKTWSFDATDNVEEVEQDRDGGEKELTEGDRKPSTPQEQEIAVNKTDSKGIFTTAQSNRAESSSTLFIKTVPPSCGRSDLLHVLETTEGFVSLTLSEAYPYKNFHRVGWVTYNTPEHCAKAVGYLNGRKFKDFELMVKINKSSEERVKITPPVAGEEARFKIDLEMTLKLITQMDMEKGIQNNPLTTVEPQNIKETLDQRIAYLRHVHFYCYYCGEEYEDLQELHRKCGVKHLRGKKKDPTTQMDVANEPWASSLDQKTKYRLEHPDNPNEYTGKNAINEATEKFLDEKVSKINDEKFRCGICHKLFAGNHFVRKHLSLKHEKEVEELKKQVIEEQFVINYMSDPRKFTPSSTQSNYQPRISMDRQQQRDLRLERQNRYLPTNQGDQYGPMRNFMSRSRGDRGRTQRPGQRINRGDFRPYDRPISHLEPPPGVERDPRSIREYVDLDAPQDDSVVHIDYRISAPSIEENE